MPVLENSLQQGQQQRNPQGSSNPVRYASQKTPTHPDVLTKNAKGDWVRGKE
jgi:hypothetical protein